MPRPTQGSCATCRSSWPRRRDKEAGGKTPDPSDINLGGAVCTVKALLDSSSTERHTARALQHPICGVAATRAHSLRHGPAIQRRDRAELRQRRPSLPRLYSRERTPRDKARRSIRGTRRCSTTARVAPLGDDGAMHSSVISWSPAPKRTAKPTRLSRPPPRLVPGEPPGEKRRAAPPAAYRARSRPPGAIHKRAHRRPNRASSTGGGQVPPAITAWTSSIVLGHVLKFSKPFVQTTPSKRAKPSKNP